MARLKWTASDERGRSRMKVDSLAQTLLDANERCPMKVDGQKRSKMYVPKVSCPENHSLTIKMAVFDLKMPF